MPDDARLGDDAVTVVPPPTIRVLCDTCHKGTAVPLPVADEAELAGAVAHLTATVDDACSCPEPRPWLWWAQA